MALAIICNNPPGGFFSITYSHDFLASGGTPPYDIAVSAGALPDGLGFFPPGSGHLIGLPTVAGLFEFALTVTDAVEDTVTIGCSIRIWGCPPNAQGVV